MYCNHQRRSLNDMHCNLLLAEIAKHSMVSAALVGTVLETGCRPKELLALTWGDLDSDSHTLTITHSKQSSVRVLPLSRELVQMFLDLQPLLSTPSDTIFTADQVGAAYTDLRIAVGVLGLPEVGWNDLRLQFVARLLDSELPASEILHRAGYTLVNLNLRRWTK